MWAQQCDMTYASRLRCWSWRALLVQQRCGLRRLFERVKSRAWTEYPFEATRTEGLCLSCWTLTILHLCCTLMWLFPSPRSSWSYIPHLRNTGRCKAIIWKCVKCGMFDKPAQPGLQARSDEYYQRFEYRWLYMIIKCQWKAYRVWDIPISMCGCLMNCRDIQRAYIGHGMEWIRAYIS